jgi:hypothetical protein
MRDWLMVLGPLVLAIYFVLNPDQFHSSLDWIGRVVG